MRIFITGLGGFAGPYLAHELLDRGHSVGGLVRRQPSRELIRRLAGRLTPERIAVGDVCDRAATSEAIHRFRPDGVIHLAAQSSVGRGEDDAGPTFAVNTIGTLQVLGAARRLDPSCRVLVVSSGESYGLAAGALPLPETTPLRPRSVYGVSKAAAELLVQQAVDGYGSDIVVARPFNHTGRGQSPRFVCADFARQIVAVERGQQPAVRIGNVEAVRDFLDVRDVVRAYLAIFEVGERGVAYNVASGVGRRIGDVLEDFRRGSSQTVPVEVDQSRLRPVDIPVLIGDNRRVSSTGWQPRFQWQETLEAVLADWREH